MYKIIGSDKKEYGPVGVEELRQWLREGRANAQSYVRAEGSADWRPLLTFPELAALLSSGPPVVPPPFSAVPESSARAGKTNGMAIAGFVFSLLGFTCCCSCGIFPLLGLVFSGVGLFQVLNDKTQRGKELAIAGLIISIVAICFKGLMMLFLSVAGAH